MTPAAKLLKVKSRVGLNGLLMVANTEVFGSCIIGKPHPKKGDRCYTHGSTRGEQTAHLNEFASDGVAGRLLNFLSVEPHTEREGAEPYIHSLQEWVEISRRLLLPYYEEGRLYIAKGKADDFLSDPNNPAYIYSPSVLKRLVEKYSDR